MKAAGGYVRQTALRPSARRSAGLIAGGECPDTGPATFESSKVARGVAPPCPAAMIGRMKRVLLCCLALAACGVQSVPVYLKPGAESGLALREEAVCREEARRAIPERRRVTTAPSIGIGIGGGSQTRAGVVFGVGNSGDVYDYDSNAGLRGEAIGACMGGKGYTLITLPACRGATRALESLPFDTTGLCVANGTIAAPI